MADTILILIKSDPLKSHRPVEAVRIALGLISSEHAVAVILLNQAPRLLAADTEDLVDDDILQKYLPALKALDHTFWVEEDSFKTVPLDHTDYSIQTVSTAKINELIRQADRFLIF